MKSTTLCLSFCLFLSFFNTHFAIGKDDKLAVAECEKLGGSVRKIAANVDWKEAAFHLSGKELNDAGLVHVGKLENLVWLNLRGTKISDAGLINLKNVKSLQKLHLEKTSVTDQGLPHLSGLENLTYLNLYGTVVTDAGLKSLYGLKKLQKIYLWQTKVTDAGVDALKKAIPKLQVIRGTTVTPAKFEEPKKA